jgi:hypothetical protein
MQLMPLRVGFHIVLLTEAVDDRYSLLLIVHRNSFYFGSHI